MIQTRHELVAPEEIDPDQRGREVREQLGRMDLVIENALAEGQGVFATSRPAKNDRTHSTSKVPRLRTPRSCMR